MLDSDGTVSVEREKLAEEREENAFKRQQGTGAEVEAQRLVGFW